jgi:hypothetical protein
MKQRLFLTEKSVLILVFGFLFLTGSATKGDNLYVYKNDGAVEAVSPDNLQKLTFSETCMEIHLKEGEVNSIAFDALRLFSFITYNFTLTGIVVPEPTTEWSVYPNPVVNEVRVENEKTITRLTVSDVQGKNLLRIYPGTLETTVSLAAYPKGIYVLQIVGENGTAIKKIIKN